MYRSHKTETVKSCINLSFQTFETENWR